jgi:hypothetical protein
METYIVITREAGDECLTRPATEKQLAGTFKGLLEYMIDPKHEQGSEAYTGDQQRLSNSIKQAYNNPASGFNVAYLDVNDELCPVELTAVVGVQPDMYHEDSIVREGQVCKLQKVLLSCDTAYVGGLPYSVR